MILLMDKKLSIKHKKNTSLNKVKTEKTREMEQYRFEGNSQEIKKNRNKKERENQARETPY